jgi:hypothetical protein
MAPALSEDVSVEVSLALELATAAGKAEAALSDLSCADRFPWRELCLIDFPAISLSDFAAVSALAAVACEGPPNATKSPIANINAKRALAVIIIWLSPH